MLSLLYGPFLTSIHDYWKNHIFDCMGTSLVAQMVKHLYTLWETQFRALGWEDPLEKEMATHSSTFAWKILWTELDGLQSMGLQELDQLSD